MITNKSFTIRVGHTQPWTSTIAAQTWYQYHLNIKLKAFFEKFFGDKFFQNRGVSFSHVIPKFFNSSLSLQVFLHDSKLYDYFSTKPSRRALRLVRSKIKLRKLFKKFKKFKRLTRSTSRKSKHKIRIFRKIKFKRFSKSTQSRFLVSSGNKSFFRRRFFKNKTTIAAKKNSFISSKQTLEYKFKKNLFFRARFKNVTKFVKSSRKIQKRFKSSKFRIFKIVKLKRSKQNFSNSKYNFIINRRRFLSSLFRNRRRFKKKFFKFKKFKKKSYYLNSRRRRFLLNRIKFKKKQVRKTKRVTRSKLRKIYSKKISHIARRFSARFKLKLRRSKIKILRFYLKKINTSNFSQNPKFIKSLRTYYLKKKYAIFNNLRNKKDFRTKILKRSRLGKKISKIRYLKKSIPFRKPKSSIFSRKLKFYHKSSRFFYKSNRSNTKLSSKRFTYFKKRRVRFPHWRVRRLPISETGRKAAKFIFFTPLSGYASPNFIRYGFYKFLGKFLSSQIFKSFNVPVFIKFNFFPLHRAGSDFYLNFITTKLYYRYILSDVIKPIVRISLKFYRGFVINCNGRFTRAQMAVSKKFVRKSVSYSKITSALDYGQRNVVLKYGTCNLRIWIRK
jgi:hypothetical protein